MAVGCMKNKIYKIALFEHIGPLSIQNNIVSKSFLHDQNNFELKFKRRKLSNKVQTMLHPLLLSVLSWIKWSQLIEYRDFYLAHSNTVLYI